MLVNPIGNIFDVEPQSGLEWGVAIAIGAGSLVVSFLTKFITKTFFKKTPEQIAAEEARLAAQPVRYREHFWQILRQPKPDHVVEKEKSQKKLLKEQSSRVTVETVSNGASRGAGVTDGRVEIEENGATSSSVVVHL